MLNIFIFFLLVIKLFIYKILISKVFKNLTCMKCKISLIINKKVFLKAKINDFTFKKGNFC